MEILKWSKNQIEADFKNCERLADVISNIEKNLEETQQVVCQIKVNDLLLTDRDEKKFADTKLQEIESLEIAYRTSEFLLRDSVVSLAAWMSELRNSVIETGEKFRTAEAGSLAYAFSRVLNNVSWLIDALQTVKAHTVLTSEWANCETRLIAALQELETGYRVQDNILVADVLEYEVSMALDQWREILSKVIAT
jgi:hypothetical protein